MFEQRRGQELYEAFLAYTQEALNEITWPHISSDIRNEPVVQAREYLLKRRGFRGNHLDVFEFGFYPSEQDVRARLGFQGFESWEVAATGLVAEGRWEYRLIGPWRGHWGRIEGFWTLDTRDSEQPVEQYLGLKEGGWTCPFGLASAWGKELVLVESPLDALSLRARGMGNVIASGGRLGKAQVVALGDAGVTALTLSFDYDRRTDVAKNGLQETLDALDNAPFQVNAVDPAAMAEAYALANEPHSDRVSLDAFIRRCGAQAFERLRLNPVSGRLYPTFERGEAREANAGKCSPLG